jgi:biopolymer transport protein ExbB
MLCLLVVLLTSSPVQAWWDGEWTIRKKIVVDTGAAGSAITEPIGPTAVLIRLHDGNFQFAFAKEDASDLRFVAADDKTLLPYHLEKFDPLLNEAFIWVKIPDLQPGTQNAIWLYYGNTGAKAVKVEDAKATYDADTVLVYHFNERGTPANDFTMGGNNAAKAGTPVDGSMIAGGLRLDGSSAIDIPASPALTWAAGAAMTWTAWVKPTALGPNAVLFGRKDDASAFAIGIDNGSPYVEANGQRSAAGSPVAINSWHHLAVVTAGPQVTLYLDGVPYGTLAASLPALNGPLQLGGDGSTEPPVGPNFVGEIDELQISKTARPAGFIKLAAFGQSGDKSASLLIFNQDEQATNWLSWLKSGTFGIIIGSLTFDGWVVIGILMVMAVLSWFVMVTKVRYLNGISKGNALFMKEWKHVASDLTVIDDADAERFKTMGGRVDKAGQRAMRDASVYRIYHIGVEEIRHRLAADQGEGVRKGLAGRSIQAIRASLDGGLVRETQKINRLIVLLTICISGGPFLGLLGTVVGVMITFAAVAAAGEVNVNAIAPGIAAALLATVAGLAVAIPSLFGYNYILSRVKDAKDDMHIFIDEFVTKMAEFYRES